MKRIISVLVLVCMLFTQNSMIAYAMTNDTSVNSGVEVSGVSVKQSPAAKKTYTPNTQTYTTEDGSSHTIVWAQGITPPKMTNDKSLQGTDGYFERELIQSSTGRHEVFQYPYEPGNGYYDLNKNTYRMGTESHLCYFGSAMNLIYWWFGQNKDYIAEYTNRLQNTDIYGQPSGLKKILPYDQQLWTDIMSEPAINYVQDVGYSQEIGTSQLARRALSYYFTRDKGFYTDAVIDYFINGYPAANSSDGSYANRPEEYIMDNTGGYFYPIFDKQMITQRYQDGRASQYSFYNENMAKFFNDGKGVGIAYKIGGNTLAHAITVWGAEYDENGNLIRFYVTDTDDYQYPTNMKPDTLRGMHTMNVYPSADGLMLMGNNIDNKTDGARVYYITTMSLMQDKWEEVLADTTSPEQPNIIAQPQDEIYPVGAQARSTTVQAQSVGRTFLTYQWYECDQDGGNPRKLQGQTTVTLSPDISSVGTKYYYCDVISNKNGHELPTKTRIVKIVVDPNIELTNALPPRFNFNVSTKTCNVNDQITLDTNAYSNDGGTLSFQWYEAGDSSGRDARKLSGQTGQTFVVPTDRSTKKYYFCEITNTNNDCTGIRDVTKKTGVKCIIVDASDRTAANAIVSMINAINPSDYSYDSYQNLQNYYNAYERDLGWGNTQAEVDLATSELIMAYESLVPYFSLELAYNDEGTVNVKYSNTNTQNKSHSILYGTQVTLNVSANAGYEFVGWYEGVTQRMFSTSPSYNFDMAANLKLDAVFKQIGTANLTFTNRTGQYVETLNKTNVDWSSITSLASFLPKVPYSYGYTNGKWNYDEQSVLSKLRQGEDVVIAPKYDKTNAFIPELPQTNIDKPNLKLHYQYDSNAKVGSFILASAIPENCRVVSSGVLFALGTKQEFDPTAIILNQNNKTLVSQFSGSYTEPLNIVNILRLDNRHNVAAKGYVTYYDKFGALKTAYSNQINIVNCQEV